MNKIKVTAVHYRCEGCNKTITGLYVGESPETCVGFCERCGHMATFNRETGQPTTIALTAFRRAAIAFEKKIGLPGEP